MPEKDKEYLIRKCPKNMCGERLKVEEKGGVRMNYKKGRGGRREANSA